MYYAMVAFCSTLLFLGALRRAAYRYGLVHGPSSRKTHQGDIPVVGGLAIGAAFLHPWRRHAVVFLGDAGSMFLGFILVWFAVFITQTPLRDFYAISAVWILGLPIMDTVHVMLRRMIRGMSPFSADRRHVHHTLMYIGLSETQTTWLLLAVSLLFGGIGFFGWFYDIPEYVLTYAFLVTFITHCTFMQWWREVFRFFGFRQLNSIAQPIVEIKAVTE